MRRFLAFLSLLLAALCSQGFKPVYTQVTCMYDIKRGELAEYKRTFAYYLRYFDMLLASDSNLIIFGGKDLQDYVWERRKEENTVFVLQEIEELKQTWFYPLAEPIRRGHMEDPKFKFKAHPQFSLEYYNLIMFSKTIMMQRALQYDKFNSDFFLWTDGGLMHVYDFNIVSPYNLIKRLYQYLQPQWQFFSYLDSNMFMGYKNDPKMYLNRTVKEDEAVLGGNFGGYIEAVRDVKSAYENFLRIILENGDLNSDESVLSMLTIKFPYLFPNVIRLGVDAFYNMLKIRMDVNRKPQHSRFFEGDFDAEGNLVTYQNRILTKYLVTGKTEEVESLPYVAFTHQNTYQSIEPIKDEYFEELRFEREHYHRQINIGLACLCLLIGFYLYVRSFIGKVKAESLNEFMEVKTAAQTE